MFVVIFLAGVIFPLPINTILIAIGAFAIDQYFDIKISFFVALVANTLGDLVPYYFFRIYGKVIVKETYAKKYSYFMRIERYMETHTGLSIVVSRIIGLFGQPVNFLTGFTNVPFLTFLFFDIVGNILFVAIFLGVGYFVGDAWVVVSNFVSTAMTAVLIVILFFIIYTIVRKNGTYN